GLLGGIGLELERPVQEREGLVDLVASDSERSRPPRPFHRLRAQALSLVLPAGPGQVDVLGSDSLRVVVREQRGMLVVTLAARLEPAGKRSVESGPPGLGQAAVRD